MLLHMLNNATIHKEDGRATDAADDLYFGGRIFPTNSSVFSYLKIFGHRTIFFSFRQRAEAAAATKPLR